MTATLSQARDEMLGQFTTAWDADANSMNVPVLYWDTKDDPPEPPDPFARIVVQHNPIQVGQATVGSAAGQRRFRRNGLVTVQIFTPLGDGLQIADTLATIARSAFEGKSTEPGDVIFRTVSVTEIGQDEGGWFQTNVIAEFEYDEIV